MVAFILAVMLSMTDASAAASADHAIAADASAHAKPKAPAPDPNRIVCRWEDSYGSKMQRRTCRPASEWDAQEHQVQQMLRDINHSSAQNLGPGVPSAMSPGGGGGP